MEDNKEQQEKLEGKLEEKKEVFKNTLPVEKEEEIVRQQSFSSLEEQTFVNYQPEIDPDDELDKEVKELDNIAVKKQSFFKKIFSKKNKPAKSNIASKENIDNLKSTESKDIKKEVKPAKPKKAPKEKKIKQQNEFIKFYKNFMKDRTFIKGLVSLKFFKIKDKDVVITPEEDPNFKESDYIDKDGDFNATKYYTRYKSNLVYNHITLEEAHENVRNQRLIMWIQVFIAISLIFAISSLYPLNTEDRKVLFNNDYNQYLYVSNTDFNNKSYLINFSTNFIKFVEEVSFNLPDITDPALIQDNYVKATQIAILNQKYKLRNLNKYIKEPRSEVFTQVYSKMNNNIRLILYGGIVRVVNITDVNVISGNNDIKVLTIKGYIDQELNPLNSYFHYPEIAKAIKPLQETLDRLKGNQRPTEKDKDLFQNTISKYDEYMNYLNKYITQYSFEANITIQNYKQDLVQRDPENDYMGIGLNVIKYNYKDSMIIDKADRPKDIIQKK